MKRVIILLQIMALVVFSVAGQNVTYSSELLQKAQVGDVQAMVDLGYCYYIGEGVAQDYSKAFVWYKKAADLGVVFAMGKLGKMFYYGHGTAKDYSKAFEWLKKTVENENALPDGDSMNLLSTCYRFGFGTTKDLNKAEYWLKKAQETGNENARSIMDLLSR